MVLTEVKIDFEHTTLTLVTVRVNFLQPEVHSFTMDSTNFLPALPRGGCIIFPGNRFMIRSHWVNKRFCRGDMLANSEVRIRDSFRTVRPQPTPGPGLILHVPILIQMFLASHGAVELYVLIQCVESLGQPPNAPVHFVDVGLDGVLTIHLSPLIGDVRAFRQAFLLLLPELSQS